MTGGNSRVFLIALGANQPSDAGSPRATLIAALEALERNGIRLIRSSRMYRTPCFPAGAGPDYVNAAAVAEGPADPGAMLATLHRIEAEFGRARVSRWASRSLDLDLIAAGDMVLPDAQQQDRWRALPAQRQSVEAPDTLILPHPRMQDRAFVLVPLAEVAPDWVHPRTGQSVAQMLKVSPPEDVAQVVPC
ncbi:MAG: 2-amino-4-hydroxy-6-hydroxymethyldihydropteridine diphosphokinase [Roseivivax sp.]|nr:2-amino-4-hydroxy-6-hydroxymethyldihydropteridine diphosphokinase [Roseivivax sp.]